MQSEEGGELPSGHDRGESFLKEYGPFSGILRNWGSKSQRLIKMSLSRLAAGPQRVH